MEQIACEESSKLDSGFKCEKVLESVDESITCPTPQKNDESITCPTPQKNDESSTCPTSQKNDEPLTIKTKEGQVQIPKKYWGIAHLFGHMSCSLRLLRLRKRTPTFQNISRQVEILSKRKFSHAHLAQMKYILPEGICIDKVLVHDKKSLCMMPDMKITLRLEVMEDCSRESGHLALWRYFNSRLVDFLKMHPEVADIPEAPLPEPFSRKTCSLSVEDSHVEELTSRSLHVNSSTELLSISNEIEILPEKLQLYSSFSRRFSQKYVADQTEKFQCFSFPKTSLSSDCLDNKESEKALQKECAPLSDNVADLNMERGHMKESFSMSVQSSVNNTPVHVILPPHSVTCNNSESPDMKNISCAADSFVIETPAQSARAKLLPISDVKIQNTPIQKSTSCHKPAKRVLDFSFMEGNDGLDITVDKFEPSRALHEFDSFPESGRGCSFGSVSVLQEAEESLGCSFEKIVQNQADLDTRHKKKSPLLDLVNVIHSIFQSLNRTPITKEELLHKILMNNLDVVDMREVEEQIESLEKLVPDWICKKSVPFGDMYCINKLSDLDSVRSRLSSNETI